MTTSKSFFFLLTGNLTILSLVMMIYMIVSKTSMIMEIYVSTFMNMSMSMMIDTVSLTFMVTVFFISSLVMMYSVEYMKGENENKFMIIMMLFISFRYFDVMQ